MGATTYPLVTSKTRYAITLTSGTSWTVPTGCLYVNAKLFGGGGGGGGTNANPVAVTANGGQVIESNFATTPGATVSYAIGAGGTRGPSGGALSGTQGGSTTMTGATTAVGGNGGPSLGSGSPANAGDGTAGEGANNYGVSGSSGNGGGTGGAGKILIEYWA